MLVLDQHQTSHEATRKVCRAQDSVHARVCRHEETALTLAAWRVHAHARREFIQAANSIGQNVQRVSSQPHLRRAARMPSAIFRSLHQRYQFEFHLATIKTQPITRASDGRKTHCPQ